MRNLHREKLSFISIQPGKACSSTFPTFYFVEVNHESRLIFKKKKFRLHFFMGEKQRICRCILNQGQHSDYFLDFEEVEIPSLPSLQPLQ